MTNVTSDILVLLAPYINFLLELRLHAKKFKDWGWADEIRRELEKLGLQVNDYRHKSTATMRIGARWVLKDEDTISSARA